MTAAPIRSPRYRSAFIAARAAAAVVLAVSLAACTGSDSGSTSADRATSQADPSIAASAPEGLDPFYTQSVSWTPCEDGLQCAQVKVPVDYADPAGETITLAAVRTQSSGTKKGSILVNPGGPGGSGYDYVLGAQQTISKDLRESYDLVGFDPRGVKRSAPVTCLDDAARDAARAANYDLETDAGLASAIADNKVFAEACAANTGTILGHVDTVSAARDMDVLRAVLNDAKLNYLGFSYGTFLGSTYASLFPDTVGRMVLDGALDPSLSNEELTRGQARGFEKAIAAYVASCLAESGCPLSGTVEDGVSQIQDLITAVSANPQTIPDGRTVTGNLLVSGLITPLYADESWPALTQALGAAFSGDLSLMMRLADLGADRAEDGTYTSNSAFAFNAVNCLDYPMVTDVAAMRADARLLEQDSPTLGKFLAYGGTSCQDWAYPSIRTPAAVQYTGDAPIVVIGTTGDPATPVEWAGALREQLGNASLLTWRGEGHTAYGRSNSCISDAVNQYFLDGTEPTDKTVC